MSNTRVRKVLLTISIAGAVNFFACGVGGVLLGGNAISARSSCPRGDYVADHGVCHPVTHVAYVYSKLHNDSAIVSAPFVLGATLILLYLRAAAAADAPHSR